MDRANLAQKLLQNVMTEERASEIIGDFLETHSQSALTPFNLVFIRLFLSFAWRPITALFAAVVIGSVSSVVLFVKASKQLWLGPIHNSILLFHTMQYTRISAPLWAMAAFTLVCFGVRDRLWIVSSLYACVSSAAVYSYWMPQEKPIVWVILSIAVVLSLSTASMRRAFGLAAIVLTLSLVTNHFQEALTREVLRYHRTPIMMVISAVLFLFSVPLVQATLCIALHQRMIAMKQLIAR